MAEYDSRTIARFWSKVDKRGPDECWLWTACSDLAGYGRFWFKRTGQREQRAHRFSWMLANGQIPDRLLVLHSCSERYPAGDLTNRRCVNPSHLRTGTDAENSDDKHAQSRQVVLRGEAHGMAKLTEADVIAIRNEPGLHREIARRFGVSQFTVSSIKRLESWAHVQSKAPSRT